MRQLSGTDTSFLNMETATQFGHVSSIIFLEPDGTDGSTVYGDFKRTVEERIHLLPVYRRRLVTDPLNLDNPYWVDDADLDLEFHIRELALPRPGDARQFGEQVARLMGRPLDRSRPLWEWYVISGLEDGSVALFSKIHHATIDGASGIELIHVLLDTDPAGREVELPAEPWQPERPPSSAELLARAAWGLALRPQKVARAQARLLRAGPRAVGNPAVRSLVSSWFDLSADRQARRRTPGLSAPPTPFNKSITAHRRFAYRTLRLSDAQTVKRAFGVTVNDVVMALCASALRSYLAAHDALPSEPLSAIVPISVRTGDETDSFSTKVTGTTCPLHTHLEDPIERLQAIHESMASAKELQRAVPADALTDITQFTPPALAAQASRVSSSIGMADRMRPLANLTISNVPGPRQPLFLSGRAMSHLYPVSMVMDGLGLNMTVQSYLDNLDFGLIACRELVPDLWDLCDLLEPAMAELLDAAAPPPRSRSSAARSRSSSTTRRRAKRS
jgi:WS/DGAT/MGAT family acyltransferase